MISERLQRKLVRLLFLALCLLPTVVIALVSIIYRTPQYLDQYQRSLSAQLAMPVTIRQVRHPAPGEVSVYGVDIRDPIHGTPLVRIEQVRWRERHEGQQIRLVRPVVYLAADKPIGSQLRAVFVRLLHGLTEQAEVQIDVLTIRWHALNGSAGNQTHRQPYARSLHDVVARFSPNGGLSARFHLPGNTDQLEFHVRRCKPEPQHTDVERAEWIAEFRAEGGPLPIAVVRPQWEGRFGVSATIQGTVRWSWGEQERVEWTGRMENVAPSRVLRGWSPYRIDGTASLTVEQLTIVDGRVQTMRGELRLEDGQVDRAVLDEFTRAVSVSLTLDPADEELLPIAGLHVAFHIDGPDLHLASAEISQQADHGVLIRLQAPKTLQVTDLVRMLVPQSDHLVPATSAARQMLGLFAWPELARQTQPERPPASVVRRPSALDDEGRK